MDNLVEENLKSYLAIAMLILSGFVLFFSFCGRYSTDVLLPSLIPVFGVEFGVIYIVFQIGYCYYFCEKKAFWWMGLTLTGMFILAWIGSTDVISARAIPYTYLRVAIVGGSCFSAAVLGIGTLKGKL